MEGFLRTLREVLKYDKKEGLILVKIDKGIETSPEKRAEKKQTIWILG